MKMTKGEAANKKNCMKGAAFTPPEGHRGHLGLGTSERRGDDEEEGKKGIDGVGGKGKTVVVAIRMDSQSRELLTWALVKAACAGDRVVALHAISASSSGAAAASGEPGAVIALARELDAMLAVYEGFCDLKQIDLKMKLCKGSSIRKVLVREVKAFAASTLILGVAKKNFSLGSSPVSIAKYCAKKLPSDCTVLALSYGKIVFQREAAGNPKTPEKLSKDFGKDSREADGELYCLLPLVGKNGRKNENSVPSIEPSDGVNDFRINTADEGSLSKDLGEDSREADGELYCLLPLVGKNGRKEENSIPSIESTDGVNVCSVNTADEGSLNKDLGKDSREADGELYCLLPLVGKKGRKEENSIPSIESTDGVNICSVNTAGEDSSVVDASSSSNCPFCSLKCDVPVANSFMNEDPFSLAPMKRSGAPFRQSSKLSVIQWVSRLRYRHTSVHPDRKFAKLDDSVMQGLDGSSDISDKSLSSPSLLIGDSNGSLLEERKFPTKKFSSACQLLSYEELERATSHFSPENLIGKGGSSSVYKGSLPDGKKLAVKILEPSTDAIEDFTSEIQILTTLNHRNIISIVGFCLEKNNMILVYDYIPRGSLEEMLHGDKLHEHILSWSERFKVAIGVADALNYLHEGSNREPVIHRDVKSSNILLCEDFDPRLSDFGLAKWASASTSELACNDTAGTFGYFAPELFTYGKVNEKADVYAFGVVLLELLSGRKPISNSCPKGPESLVVWAKQMLQNGDFRDILDPSIRIEYDGDQAERMCLAASLCIRRLHQVRPKMSLVLKILQGDDDAVKWATMEATAPEGLEGVEEELIDLTSDIQSHLSLALLDVEDEMLSIGSTDHTFYSSTASTSMRENSECTWSRSSSFE